MAAVCSCCGQSVDGFDVEAVVVRNRLPRIQAQILRILAKAKGHRVPCDRLAFLLYQHDASGGPDDANGIVRTYMCMLRKSIANEPLKITVSRREGYSLVIGGAV